MLKVKGKNVLSAKCTEVSEAEWPLSELYYMYNWILITYSLTLKF